MKTFFIPKFNVTNTTTVDIGTGPAQIPNNTIVQNKLNTYDILTKSVGTENNQLTDNARVISLIEEPLIPIVETITNISQTVNDNNIFISLNEGRLSSKLLCMEPLIKGRYVSIYKEGGVNKLRHANASLGYLANGYILNDFNNNSLVTYYYTGENPFGNSLAIGSLYLDYLSDGHGSNTPPPDKSGFWLQELGEVITPTLHLFQLGMKLRLM